MAAVFNGAGCELAIAYNQFLHAHADVYGYGKATAYQACNDNRSQPAAQNESTAVAGTELFIDKLRREEFRRLLPSPDNPQGITPLDHAGAALYSEIQLQQIFQEMQTQLLCNPHSASQPGSLAARQREELTCHTLAMCNAPSDQYDVIFTSGATAAIKLVAEGLPWCPHSCLVHCLSAHNSVLGMRQLVLAAGGSVQVVQPTAAEDPQPTTVGPPPPAAATAAGGRAYALNSAVPVSSNEDMGFAAPVYGCAVLKPCAPLLRRVTASRGQALETGSGQEGMQAGTGVHLAVLPHECNFTGQQLDLRLVQELQAGRQLHWLLPPVQHQHTPSNPAAPQPQPQPSQHSTGHPTINGPALQEQSQLDQAAEVASAQGAGIPGLDAGDAAVRAAHVPPDRWLVMLDAAKSCATSPPDLTQYPADMVALSYYKVMGYPTGLGALIIHKDVLPLLTANKGYFGGGTVAVSVADQDWVVRRPGPAGLEDGTHAFAAVAAACHGFLFLKRLGGFPAVSGHTRALSDHLHVGLLYLRHANGRQLAVVYGREQGTPGVVGWGPTVAFNLKRPDGTWIGYTEVSRLAELHGLQLRTGCFCNPGACALHLGLTGADMRDNYESGHVCWDERDVLRGRPTGAVRVSLGHVSTFGDVHCFLGFLQHYFLDHQSSPGLEFTTPTTDLTPTPSLIPPSSTEPPHVLSTQNGFGLPHSNGASSSSRGVLNPRPHTATSKGRDVSLHSTDAVGDSTSQTQSSQPAPAPALSQPSTEHYSISGGVLVHPRTSNSMQSNGGPRAADSSSLDVAPLHGLAAPAATAVLDDQRPEVNSQHGSTGHAHAGANDAACACVRVSAMYVYPIKSCAAQQVQRWPVGPTGLMYDREWALVDPSGRVVTQKACPLAALISPRIDLPARTLVITPPPGVALEPLVVPLDAGNQEVAGVGQTGGLVAGEGTGLGGGSLGMARTGQDTVLATGSAGVVAGVRAALERGAVGGTKVVAAVEEQLAHVSVCGDKVCGAVVAATVRPQIASADGIPKRTLADNDSVDSAVKAAVAGVSVVRAWFEAAIGVSCILVRQRGGERRARAGTGGTGRPAKGMRPAQDASTAGGPMTTMDDQPNGATAHQGHIGFANDGQYLLVNGASVEDVNERVRSAPHAPGVPPAQPVELLRFRPNLVVEGLPPYAEDFWTGAQIGPLSCQVLGTCPRCEMLQVDQTSGTRGKPDVLLALAQYRRFNGRMHFGILLSANTASENPSLLPRTGSSTGGNSSERGCGSGVQVQEGFDCVHLAVGDEVRGLP